MTIARIAKTVWIVPTDYGFAALDHKGKVLETNKFKSTLHYVMRQHILNDNWDIWAIAEVIEPERRLKRGPNKPKRR